MRSALPRNLGLPCSPVEGDGAGLSSAAVHDHGAHKAGIFANLCRQRNVADAQPGRFAELKSGAARSAASISSSVQRCCRRLLARRSEGVWCFL